MGDELDVLEEDFSDEELEALGEKPEIPPEEETETDEGEPEVEVEEEDSPETDEEPESDEPEKHKPPEDNLIPQTVFNKRIAEERAKFELFRSDPDAYYEKYPEERPSDYRPPTQSEESLKVEGGQYDGWEFKDVFNRDPAEAYRISPYHARILHDEQLDSQRSEKEQERKRVEQSNAEIIDFSGDLAKELLEKEVKFELDAQGNLFSNDLTPKEMSKVTQRLSDTLEWMERTRRGGGILADAYYLMNVGKREQKAAATGATKVIEAASGGKVRVISSDVPGDEGLTGFDAYQRMTSEQLSAELEKFDDDKMEKFLTKAPKSLRKKFPGLPWSD